MEKKKRDEENERENERKQLESYNNISGILSSKPLMRTMTTKHASLQQ